MVLKNKKFMRILCYERKKNDRKTEKIHNAELRMCLTLFRSDGGSSPLNLTVYMRREFKGPSQKMSYHKTKTLNSKVER
jgi:hypothetical protein